MDKLVPHLESFQNRVLSYSRVVTEVMELKADRARRLLKELIDTSVEAPQSAIVCRLAAATLLQTEVKHRLKNQGQSLLPFNIQDFNEAVKYGQDNEHHYVNLETVTDENGEEVQVEKKRGRKGGSFNKVKEYVIDHPKMLEKSTDAKEAAKEIEQELGVSYNTAMQYVYKCRRLHKQGEL